MFAGLQKYAKKEQRKDGAVLHPKEVHNVSDLTAAGSKATMDNGPRIEDPQPFPTTKATKETAPPNLHQLEAGTSKTDELTSTSAPTTEGAAVPKRKREDEVITETNFNASRETSIHNAENTISAARLKVADTTVSFQQYIAAWIRRLCAQWELHLWTGCAAYTAHRSSQTKREFAVLQETREALRPLLRQLDKEALEQRMADHLYHLFRYLSEGNVLKAEEAHLNAAIGGEPWPIGIWVSGIHVRRALGAIERGTKTHPLDNDTTRGFLHAIKVLINFTAKHFIVGGRLALQ